LHSSFGVAVMASFPARPHPYIGRNPGSGTLMRRTALPPYGWPPRPDQGAGSGC
jgi:hypothetical protein